MSRRHLLERTQWVPTPLEQAFEFYSDPRNLARITPDWLGFKIVAFDPPSPSPSMSAGLRIHYTVRPLGIPQRWTSLISEWEPPNRFVDEQVRGPYRFWRHLHEFRAVGNGTELIDRVAYELPFGPLGGLAHLLLVRRQLESIFDYRERMVAELFGGDEKPEAS